LELATLHPELVDFISRSVDLVEQAQVIEQRAAETLDNTEKIIFYRKGLSLVVEAEESFLSLLSKLSGYDCMTDA